MGKRKPLRSIQQVVFSTNFCLVRFRLMRPVIWLLPWGLYPKEHWNFVFGSVSFCFDVTVQDDPISLTNQQDKNSLISFWMFSLLSIEAFSLILFL